MGPPRASRSAFATENRSLFRAYGDTFFNQLLGRDHWPKVFSVMLAGGGVQGGVIHGTSNATASEPDTDAVSPADLMTTVYHQMGIVADAELMAPGDRPIEIVNGGKVVKELLAVSG